jgi:hypothetical protein
MVLGLGRAATYEIKGTARRNAFIAIVLGVLIVGVPLAMTGVRIATDTRAQLESTTVVGAWLATTNYKIRDIQATGDQISVIIIGQGEPPAFADLVAGLIANLHHPVKVNLEVIPATSMTYP